jgi:carboxyl-terminal processing protease
LEQDKASDLEKNRKEITTVLENEIAGRYYYAYGKVKKSYQNDSEVARAIDLLNNPADYSQLLAAKK